MPSNESGSGSSYHTIDRPHLAGLIDSERERYVRAHPKARQLFAQAHHLFGRVPMTWMNMWSGGFPLYLDRAEGNRVTDVDGHTYLDFALGDTGAMAGHSPAATVAAVQHRLADLGGLTTMLPTADAEWVGAELTRRFGLPLWSFALSATDANRWAIRLARQATGRPKILVFAYCYHGSVDEVLAVPGPDGAAIARAGNVGAPVPMAATTRVVEFNDLPALRRELAHGDVAAVLMEPALTNIGIVLPEAGFLEQVRRECTATGTLLMIDETHTLSAGPGGCTQAWALQPDMFVVGKSIGGGIPCGAYGITSEVAELLAAQSGLDLMDVGGIGGTLAGNALSVTAMRATLEHVLTDAAFGPMIELATRFTAGVAAVLAASRMPWSITQLGARAEYRFAAPAPRTGTESHRAADPELDEYLHLFMINRGVLITPFHNMALMCPQTTGDDVDRHSELFGEAVAALVSG